VASVKVHELKFGELPRMRDTADKWGGHEDIAAALKANKDVWTLVELKVKTGKAVRIATLIKTGVAPGFAADEMGEFQASTRRSKIEPGAEGTEEGKYYDVYARYHFTGPIVK
jgi:hypothetical protein